MSRPLASFQRYKDMEIEVLYKLLRSMVEKADNEQMEVKERISLFEDIDELHAHILLLLGMEHNALDMLVFNHPEVYDNVYEVGNHLKSLI